MAITRRELLTATGVGLGAVIFAGCRVRPGEFEAQSPVFLPEDLVEGADAFYATLCRQCSTSEGILVRVMEGRAKKIEGNPDYPVNLGKHGARCEAALQALYHPDRIPGPLRREVRGGPLTPSTWDQALDTLVGRLRQQLGAAGKVVIMTAPQGGHLGMLTERFATIYGAQHLALETTEETVLREAVKRVFGQERLPAFDIQNAQYILSFGADFLGGWLAPVHYSRQYGEFRQGQGRRRGTLVQVEPRFSLTAANADEWVPINPGAEGLLAASIAAVIIEERLGDAAAARAMVAAVGAQALQDVRPENVNRISDIGVKAERIRELARAFAKNQPSLALGGGLAGAQTNGLFNLSAVYALNFLVDNVGKRGGVQFNPSSPLPGVPDAPRATPFREWQRLAGGMRAGEVSLALVHGVNPAYSLPSLQGKVGFGEALAKVPFIVSFSSFMDETAALADLVLPVHTPLEDWGDSVPDPGPGHQVVGFQQPVVRPFVESRGFGDILLTVAEELGGEMKARLPWSSFQELLREGARDLRRGQGTAARPGHVPAATDEEFWVGLLQQGGWWDAQKIAPALVRPTAFPAPAQPTFAGGREEYPFHLVPFPSHSMGGGEGSHLPWLQATPDPLTTAVWSTWVEVNPQDAEKNRLREGEVVEVESPAGKVEALVYVHQAMPPGRVAMPLGQGHTEYGRYAQGRGANVLQILSPETEKETGALAWGATRVRLTKTGRRIRVPKLEGFVVPVELEGFKVVQVTKG
jgi:anaerobic selenocysteine-containing dehydrogenase